MNPTSPAADALQRPHRRRNPLTGRWVLVSPHRAQRPWQGQHEAPDLAPQPAHDPQCPLCPGNLRSSGERNPDYQGPYVFANDHAALLPAPAPAGDTQDPLFAWQGAQGCCRVICHSHDHGRTLGRLGLAALGDLVDTWCEQTAELGAQLPLGAGVREQGRDDGLLATRTRTARCGPAPTCPTKPPPKTSTSAPLAHARPAAAAGRMPSAKRPGGERVVVATPHWLAVVPFWATWPFETLLLPRFAVQRLPQLDRVQRADLAVALQRPDHPLRQPVPHCAFPYSMGWHGAPVRRCRAARPLAAARPLLPAAAALGHGAQVHGRLRDAGRGAARPDARTGRRRAARRRVPRG
jgi:UDPglucose--hexose-1-phosphate uridylyltransferase